MSKRVTRRDLLLFLGGASALSYAVVAASCAGGGSHASFAGANGTPVVAPTNVTGKSNTSGISAGSALQPPSSTPTPKK